MFNVSINSAFICRFASLAGKSPRAYSPAVPTLFAWFLRVASRFQME